MATATPTITYDRLRTLAETFDDLQKHRIGQSNRLASATVNEGHWLVTKLKETEEKLSGELVEEYHHVAPPGVVLWEEETLGIGAHTVARLLGHLGHPRHAQPQYWDDNPNVADDEYGTARNPKKALHKGEPFERMLGQLWQYCGHGRAERYRAGMSQAEAFRLGSPKCKMLVHLLAAGVVIAQIRKLPDETREALDELGEFYLAEKLKYADRTHTGPCSGGYVSAGPGKVVFAKCKVEGRYADEGDPYSAGHIDSIAKRHLGKEILREIWEAAEN